jgi:hypothetical protein
MTNYEVKVRIGAPADKVAKLAATTEYAEWEAMNEGAVSAKARVEKQSGPKVTLVIERQDYSRGAGGKKTSKKERNITTQEWDTDAMRCRWNVRVPGMELLVEIRGELWLEPDGPDACFMREKGGAAIKVPLIGKTVERSITDDIKRDFPKKTAFFIEKLK